MSVNLYPILEHPVAGFDARAVPGGALARVVEAHPALSPLLDFYSLDPVEIALEVGMVSPHEEDGAADLEEIDFGPREWFEPSAGLAAVRQALQAVRDDPRSIAAATYDPGLRPEDVIADLEALEQSLTLAQQHETRFHFASRVRLEKE